MAVASSLRGISQILVIFLVMAESTWSKTNDEEAIAPELFDGAVIQALRNYATGFNDYERKLRKSGREKFFQSWSALQREIEENQHRLDQKQRQSLIDAAKTYEKQLTEFKSFSDRPLVLLNLAQVRGILAKHYESEDQNEGRLQREKAISALRELDKEHRNFEKRDQALYLLAVYLEDLERSDEALKTWRTLAYRAKDSIYGVYAHLALGDHYFALDDPAKALLRYESAQILLNRVNSEDKAFEVLRCSYRIAWAAYRSARVRTVIAAVHRLLEPGVVHISLDKLEKIRQDAVELGGDALFEYNDMQYTLATLKDPGLGQAAPEIGLRTIARLFQADAFEQVVQISTFLTKDFPLARAYPEILLFQADSYNKLGLQDRRMLALEKVSLLLPRESLWRHRHHNRTADIEKMERLALAAGRMVAVNSYEKGLTSGQAKFFHTARSFFEILIGQVPGDPDAMEWRMRMAHCSFFLGELEKAALAYKNLKKEYKLETAQLNIVSYQLVRAYEKMWRAAYKVAVEKGEKPGKNDAAVTALLNLEKAINAYVSLFPNDTRSADLLLLAAAVNRDSERLSHAAQFWQRSMLVPSKISHRAIAIRGLLAVKMQTGTSRQVVDTARRFLRLEDWQKLNVNLGKELAGVLATAAHTESNRLFEAGKVQEGGELLIEIARDFAQLPNRSQLWRDGAYMLGIAGDWQRAKQACEAYQKSGIKAHQADMIYLSGRSNEYLIRFSDAVRSYLALGRLAPKHARARVALERAEILARSEDDLLNAGEAAQIAASMALSRKESIQLLDRSVDYFIRARSYEKASNALKERTRKSRNASERLQARLLSAKLMLVQDQESKAMQAAREAVAQAQSLRKRLPAGIYQSVVAEGEMLLGRDLIQKFDDFRVSERGADWSANIKIKSEIFVQLARHFDQVAATQHPVLAIEARYLIADAAERFADDIAALPKRTDEQLTLSQTFRYRNTVKRLQDLAKRYLSRNLLVQRTETVADAEAWIEKSRARLSGSGIVAGKEGEFIPVATEYQAPLSASL